MAENRPEPKIAFLFLCDDHNYGPTGKINCYGIFNIFNVWAFPSQREGSIIMYVYNISKDEKIPIFWKTPSGKKSHLGDFKFQKSPHPQGYANTAIHVPFKITEKGIHVLEAELGGDVHQVPIIVHLEKWPDLSDKEVNEALKDPTTIKSARMKVTCTKCGRTHTFEVHLDPNAKRTPGTFEFPKNGKFKCRTKTCSQIIFTKDIEGHARSLLGKSPSKQKR